MTTSKFKVVSRDGKAYEVELTVDAPEFRRRMAMMAINNRKGRTQILHGAVRAKVVEGEGAAK